MRLFPLTLLPQPLSSAACAKYNLVRYTQVLSHFFRYRCHGCEELILVGKGCGLLLVVTVALGMHQPAQTLTLKQLDRLLWVSVTRRSNETQAA